LQTVQILLEENAYGAVRPMEVAADAPVAALVPAIVEELKLPRTDLFGNKLVYMLRYPSGGPALPDDTSLIAAGVGVGAKLALDSYVMDGSVAILMQGKERPQPSFYSSETIADGTYFPALGKNTPAALPAFRQKQTKRKSRWTRRAFLALGGAAFAAGSLGFGYAAYRRFVADSVAMPAAMRLAQTTQPVIPTAAEPVRVFAQHQRTVRSVTWSPGGNMLASGANDAQLLTWDLSGTVHVSLPQANAVRAVAWSTDGQQLAAAVANLVMFFNPLTGAALAQPAQAHTDQVTALAWSPRQPLQVVSAGLDKRAIVWNATTYMPQTVFTQHTTAVESASWAADGQTVATCSHGGAVRVWNAGNGQQTHDAFIDAQLPMRALSFASSGLLAVGGDDGIVRLWNGLVCQQQVGNQCMDMPQRFKAHMGVVRALAWSPDARLLATGGDDGTLAIWYPAQAQTPLLRVHHDAPVLALAWSSSGKQVATASGNSVTIWELH
jgi:WD domain, G-beta repeat